MDKVVIHLSFCNGKKVVHSIVLGQNYRLQTSVSVVPIYIFDIEINCCSEMFHQNTFFFHTTYSGNGNASLFLSGYKTYRPITKHNNHQISR